MINQSEYFTYISGPTIKNDMLAFEKRLLKALKEISFSFNSTRKCVQTFDAYCISIYCQSNADQ